MSAWTKSVFRQRCALILVGACASAAVLAGIFRPVGPTPRTDGPARIQPAAFRLAEEDPLDGGVAWLNTGGPIKLHDLRGKIVLLDFWTFCCINCHHVLPDLAKLEEKYKNQLVVIGVHTPKFLAERDTENLRRKVREYGIKHPVVNDADQEIWNRLGVHSWPTLGVIDPEGKVVFSISGEGHFEALDKVIGELVASFRGKGLNETPLKFFPENEKPDNTPLLFPGKILADAAGDRLFVADTGHNRVVVTDLKGREPVVIGGGAAGLTDGPYEKAAFHRPQGLALLGETLYVADTENHAIRAVDLKSRTVTTVAGAGAQSRTVAEDETPQPAGTTALNSPWDLTHAAGSRVLYIAMAGPHQIWRFDADTNRIGLWAGTGRENVVDAPRRSAAFAQPSGLATDGTHLFVADSEGSAVRSIPLAPPDAVVTTIVGTHDLPKGQSLFAFDDIDGPGTSARLQHCLGLAYGSGKLFIADTYNNKVKIYDPRTRNVRALAGSGQPGAKDSPAEFSQPGGLSLAGTTLYVADTNNHAVRVVDLLTSKVSTLPLPGLSPPRPRFRAPSFPNASLLDAPKAAVLPGDALNLSITLPIPPGYKLNAEGSLPVLVQSPGHPDLIAGPISTTGTRIDPPSKTFTVKVPLSKPSSDGDAFPLKVSVLSLVCSEGSSLCAIKSYIWTVPVSVSSTGAAEITLGGK